MEPWTEEEDAYPLTNRSKPNREVALALGRSLFAVSEHLYKPRGSGVDVPPSIAWSRSRQLGAPVKHQVKGAGGGRGPSF